MGYYNGNGVVSSRRSTPVLHCIEVVPSYYVEGEPRGWVRLVHTGVQTETVTVYNGVSDPGSMTGASITMSTTNPPHEAAFKGFEASRIGDSNLWTKVETNRTTTG